MEKIKDEKLRKILQKWRNFSMCIWKSAEGGNLIRLFWQRNPGRRFRCRYHGSGGWHRCAIAGVRRKTQWCVYRFCAEVYEGVFHHWCKISGVSGLEDNITVLSERGTGKRRKARGSIRGGTIGCVWMRMRPFSMLIKKKCKEDLNAHVVCEILATKGPVLLAGKFPAAMSRMGCSWIWAR